MKQFNITISTNNIKQNFNNFKRRTLNDQIRNDQIRIKTSKRNVYVAKYVTRM